MPTEPDGTAAREPPSATSTSSMPSDTAVRQAHAKSESLQFHGDASEFEMSFDDLADATSNQHEQLYADLTGESAKPHSDGTNQHDNQQMSPVSMNERSVEQLRDPEHSTENRPAAAVPPPLIQKPTASPRVTTDQSMPSPSTAVRKSPRRSKTGGSAKKAGGGGGGGSTAGAKRGNQNPNSSFSWNDILHVQNLIERCLQQYLSKNDIVLTLQAQAKVDPSFTVVVWQKLEEQNPAFFKAYTMLLQIKEQITAFNFLVSQQKEMMAKASGNAAFLSFLSSNDARKTQRHVPVPTGRTSRLSSARHRATTPSTSAGNVVDLMQAPSSSSSSHGFPLPSPLPLPSPMKTDLDTHAFFS